MTVSESSFSCRLIHWRLINQWKTSLMLGFVFKLFVIDSAWCQALIEWTTNSSRSTLWCSWKGKDSSISLEVSKTSVFASIYRNKSTISNLPSAFGHNVYRGESIFGFRIRWIDATDSKYPSISIYKVIHDGCIQHQHSNGFLTWNYWLKLVYGYVNRDTYS